PQPSPDSDKESKGGGCDAGLSGTAGLVLLLAASLLLRRR
ncbi:MAG: MYXO-CTERM sorting domain-containing protein, partial [Fretibacterium sp.]